MKGIRLTAVALVAVLVLGAASAAMAAPILSIKAKTDVVTFPHGTVLYVGAAEEGKPTPTRMVVQYRKIGCDTWKYLRTISASRSAEGTASVWVGHNVLDRTAGFRVISTSGGLESEVATVGVKAALSRPVVRKVVVATKRARWVEVKGFINPRHKAGTRPVEVKIWKKEGSDWVLKGTLHPKIVSQTYLGSKWAFGFKVSADRKGLWRLQVSHEDTGHVASTSGYSYVKVVAK